MKLFDSMLTSFFNGLDILAETDPFTPKNIRLLTAFGMSASLLAAGTISTKTLMDYARDQNIRRHYKNAETYVACRMGVPGNEALVKIPSALGSGEYLVTDSGFSVRKYGKICSLRVATPLDSTKPEHRITRAICVLQT